MSLSLMLDIAIIALLVPTIFFAVLLNSRLADLRRNRDELTRLMASFNEATQRAESGIPRLRKAADDAGRALQDRVEKAQILRDDLAFMVDRAESMAGRLESRARDPRPSPGEMRNDIRSEARAGSARRSDMSSDARTVQQAIAAVGLPSPPAINPRRKTAEAPTAANKSAAAPASAPASAPSPRNEDDFFIEDERSEAERELLRALQSAR